MVTKQLVLKNRWYYFFNDLIFLKDFDPKMLKLVKNDCGDRYLYHINYITKKPKLNIDSVNPLYLIIPEVIVYIEEYEGCKYLNFASTEVNNDVLSTYASVWNEILEQIKKINGSVGEFGRDYGKIKVGVVGFSDNVDLPLDRLIKLNAMTISNRLLVEKDDKYYPEVYLEECLYDNYWSN